MKLPTLIKVTLLAATFATSVSHAGVLASFEDLQLPPALNTGTGLQYTNTSNSLLYQGVAWDANFAVVGDQYRVAADGPLFGIPNSGHYFVTNQSGLSGLSITTDKVLTSAWFGRNQYYGYGGGADQITIVALHGATQLGAVVFDLPANHPGQPEPLSLVDTSSFSALSGITGYRIDRRELGTLSGHWVADDFQFANAVSPVPEPGTLPLLAVGFGVLLMRARRQASKK